MHGDHVPKVAMMLQQAGGNAWELCSKSGNDVATGTGKVWELCSKYNIDVATGRGECMGIVF